MKTTLAVILFIVGVSFLLIGYTAPSRAKAHLDLLNKARIETAKFEAEMKAKYPSAHDPAKEEHLEVLEHLTDFLEQESAETKGTMQYCTGWLIIALACTIAPFAKKENL